MVNILTHLTYWMVYSSWTYIIMHAWCIFDMYIYISFSHIREYRCAYIYNIYIYKYVHVVVNFFVELFLKGVLAEGWSWSNAALVENLTLLCIAWCSCQRVWWNYRIEASWFLCLMCTTSLTADLIKVKWSDVSCIPQAECSKEIKRAECKMLDQTGGQTRSKKSCFRNLQEQEIFQLDNFRDVEALWFVIPKVHLAKKTTMAWCMAAWLVYGIIWNHST